MTEREKLLEMLRTADALDSKRRLIKLCHTAAEYITEAPERTEARWETEGEGRVFSRCSECMQQGLPWFHFCPGMRKTDVKLYGG